ncbi:MAG: YigZ family protein [Lachnospiraceae bacterium]|nr:YigZ family protein [Lachnospiraceae bacterium]
MKVLIKAGTGEIEEKKSRFIAHLQSVESVEDAEAFIAKIKKEYWDARHNCYAFVIGKDGGVTRCSDDGEPSQTAGRPMLDVLLRSEIKDICVVVTRYFGGTLLGTGGLVRAYSAAVTEALDNSEIGELIDGIMLTIETDYTLLSKLEYYLNENDIQIASQDYADKVMLTIKFDSSRLERIKSDLTNLSGGKFVFGEPEECSFIG